MLAVGAAGTLPGGQALHMSYTGTEEQVWALVYNPMDALLAAAHLDDPSTNADDWANYEVYNDDPAQAGGSRNRDIYYVVQGDVTALTRILPPSAASAAPAAAPAAPETPAAVTPPAGAPAAATPAPAAPAPAAPAPAH